MSRYQCIHLALAVLMVLMLILPLPWASYGSGHYLSGLHFLWANFIILAMLLLHPQGGVNLAVLIFLSSAVFSLGFVFLIMLNLCSAILVRQWLSRLHRLVIVITLFSVPLTVLEWSGLGDPCVGLFVSFWLATGLVCISALTELVVYIKSHR